MQIVARREICFTTRSAAKDMIQDVAAVFPHQERRIETLLSENDSLQLCSTVKRMSPARLKTLP